MLTGPSLSSSELLQVLFLPSAVSPSSCVQKLLSKFPDVLSLDGFTALEPRHGVDHHLLTNPGPPVYAKPYRLDHEKLIAPKAKFSTIEEAGII